MDIANYYPAFTDNCRALLQIKNGMRLALLHGDTMKSCFELRVCELCCGEWQYREMGRIIRIFKTLARNAGVTDNDINGPLLCQPIIIDDNQYSGFISRSIDGNYVQSGFTVTPNIVTIAEVLEILSDHNIGCYLPSICLQLINITLDNYDYLFAIAYRTNVKLTATRYDSLLFANITTENSKIRYSKLFHEIIGNRLEYEGIDTGTNIDKLMKEVKYCNRIFIHFPCVLVSDIGKAQKLLREIFTTSFLSFAKYHSVEEFITPCFSRDPRYNYDIKMARKIFGRSVNNFNTVLSVRDKY
jgi:hypothetical protein